MCEGFLREGFPREGVHTVGVTKGLAKFQFIPNSLYACMLLCFSSSPRQKHSFVCSSNTDWTCCVWVSDSIALKMLDLVLCMMIMKLLLLVLLLAA